MGGERMKPIRILVDSFADEGLPNAQMGNAREIIRRLDPNRFHVSVFHLGKPDVHIAKRANTRLIQLARRRQTIRILREFLMGQHEILFYPKSSPASKWYLHLRRRWRDNKIIVGTMESRSDFHNEPTIRPQGVALWERTILRSDFLISNSEAVRQNLKTEYGTESEVVPTGVDTGFFTPAIGRPCNARRRVLFVGSLRPFKQPQMLLSAAARFPDADFVITGDGMMRDELKQRIIQERLPNVTLMGPLLGEHLRTEYRKADVFLFPSSWEGSPKVILEAAACGLPVIARKDYEPETVVDSKTGYLVGSDGELFFRLEALLDNPTLCAQLGQAGRKHSERFDWDIVTRRWEEIFLQLVSQRAVGCAA
jgi:glycosyltransferase involved in cell wall biosynthesis